MKTRSCIARSASAPRYPVYVLLPILFVAAASVGAVERTETERAEEAVAAEEERKLEEKGLIPDGGYEFEQEGKLTLATWTMDEQRPSILGIFTSRGRTYQVKVAREPLRKALARFNGKQVTLGGKVRNEGKYLIVQEVLSQVVPVGPGKNRGVPARM